jgi:hypothetical protein
LQGTHPQRIVKLHLRCVSDFFISQKIWMSLETKYKIEETGIEVSIISNFMDFNMSNDKLVLTQVYELLLIVGDLKTIRVDIAESFLVVAIINKLPSSWNDYKKKLKHEERKYSLESLPFMHRRRF